MILCDLWRTRSIPGKFKVKYESVTRTWKMSILYELSNSIHSKTLCFHIFFPPPRLFYWKIHPILPSKRDHLHKAIPCIGKPTTELSRQSLQTVMNSSGLRTDPWCTTTLTLKAHSPSHLTSPLLSHPYTFLLSTTLR